MSGQRNIRIIWHLSRSFPDKFVMYGVTIESLIESPMVSPTILNSPGSRVQDRPYQGYLYPPKTNYISRSPWPGTTTVLQYFCYFYTNSCWMTPELFFILTYPTYDLTFNFPFNFWTASTSLLIFWTFILMHFFAICYVHPSFWRTQLPSVFFVLQTLRDHTSHGTAHCVSSIAANPVQNPLWQPWYHPIQIRCTARAPLLYLTPNKINNAA